MLRLREERSINLNRCFVFWGFLNMKTCLRKRKQVWNASVINDNDWLLCFKKHELQADLSNSTNIMLMVVFFYIMQTPSYFRQLHHAHYSLPLANCWPVGSWTSSCYFKEAPVNENWSTLEEKTVCACFTGADSKTWPFHVNVWSMNMWDVWVSRVGTGTFSVSDHIDGDFLCFFSVRETNDHRCGTINLQDGFSTTLRLSQSQRWYLLHT